MATTELEAARNAAREGDFVGAAKGYEALLGEAPGDAALWNEFGVTLALAARWPQAETALRRALMLQPTSPEIHNNLGNVYRGMGNLPMAVACYRGALARRADYPEAQGNLGVACQQLGEFDAAVEHCRAALQAKPQDPLIWSALGAALAAQGRLAESEAAQQEALALDPDCFEAHNNLAILCKDRGEWARAIRHYESALAIRPEDAGAHSNLLMCLNYDPDAAPEAMFAAHREWDRRHGRTARSPESSSAIPDADPDRRLRIGLVSPDFREHSVASFLEAVLAHRDPEFASITCYAEVAIPDATTDRLFAMSDSHLSSVGLSDAALAERIRADGIDILVDLAGHTADNRLPVFAHRAAPVQATWLGYPATTGVAAMDYRLTDALADPPGLTEVWHAERLVRLDGGFLCYTPPPDMPMPAEATGGRPPVFGSFNNLSKLNRKVVALWSALLRRCPGARLLLKARQLDDPATRDRVSQAFAEQGVGPERLELVGRLPRRAAHLEAYASIDVALDTFPYNGATTTCEAMWMGVPVVSLVGGLHAGRVGLSVLTAAGRPDWAAATPESYLDIAAALLDERPSRAGLRECVAGSRLGDGPAFAREIERTWRCLWQQACARPSPKASP